MNTRVANICKEEFPILLSQLWDTTFKPANLVGGFKECGFFPFDRNAIPLWKVAPSLPLQGEPCEPVKAETPLRTELRKCFVEVLKPKLNQKGGRKSNYITMVKPSLTMKLMNSYYRKNRKERERRKLREKRGDRDSYWHSPI